MSAHGELPHHHFRVDEVFRASQADESDFQDVVRGYSGWPVSRIPSGFPTVATWYLLVRGFKRLANPFAVHRSQLNDLSVLALEGFLDAHTAPVFEQAIQSEIESGNLRVIVDCEKLTYISSAGLGVFMSFIEEIREQGGDIKICGPIPKVRHVFEILGFASLFDIVDTLPEAAQKFSEPASQER